MVGATRGAWRWCAGLDVNVSRRVRALGRSVVGTARRTRGSGLTSLNVSLRVASRRTVVGTTWGSWRRCAGLDVDMVNVSGLGSTARWSMVGATRGARGRRGLAGLEVYDVLDVPGVWWWRRVALGRAMRRWVGRATADEDGGSVL